MGEVNTEKKGNGQGKGLIKKGKKLSTRVDMTPVVDLAFLLLTFFMLATTFIKPQIMELVLPEKQDEDKKIKQPKVNEKKVMSVVLDGNKKIYWYIGMTNPSVQETDYSSKGINKVLQEQNRLIEKIVVLVKPEKTSTFENLVDIFDELENTGIARYALVDIEPEDQVIVDKYRGTTATAASVSGNNSTSG